MALAPAPAAWATAQPLAGGQTRLELNRGIVMALRKEGVSIQPLGPAQLKGRRLTLPVASGAFDHGADSATFLQSGGLRLVSGRKAVALRRLTLDLAGKSVSATLAGRRMRLAKLWGGVLERDGGFDARLEVKRLPLSRAAAAALNRVLGLPEVLRAGRSLGSVNGLGEASEVPIAWGTIAMGGPDTAFSKLESIGVQIGLWGAAEGWGREIGEPYSLFPVEPTAVAPDASAGILAGYPNDGMSMQLYESPPRDMLLRGPRIDLATRELSARLSAMSAEDPGVTGTIATLDYSTAQLQVRPRVGAFELMGIRAVASQFIADQLNARLATPGTFQAGETLAQVTVTLHSPVTD